MLNLPENPENRTKTPNRSILTDIQHKLKIDILLYMERQKEKTSPLPQQIIYWRLSQWQL